MSEILAIVGGGLAVERINERIKEQVFELAGPGSMGHSTAAIVGAMIWFVAAAFVIWFHDKVVNEWMRRKVDGQKRRQGIVYDMNSYLSQRMSLEYNLGLMEHLVGVAPRVKAGPDAMGSSAPLKPTDKVP